MRSKPSAIFMAPSGRPILYVLSFCLALAFSLPARADLDIVEVTSAKGIKAWLVEDPSDPLVAISFAFKGGTIQEPQGKEGVAGLTVGLLEDGAGNLDADAFQQRLYESGADLSLYPSSDMIAGTLRVLAGETEEPLELLSLALSAPRFEADEFARERSRTLSRLRAEKNDPDSRGARELASVLYGDHPLGRLATEETVSALTRDDLAAFHRRMFARSNLVVGVVGAIDPETLKRVLDEVFGGLPEKADLAEIPPPTLNFGRQVREVYDRPQTSTSLFYPGPATASPELYPASLLVQILGGGGLDSRLFTELRERRGLTYGANAALDSATGWGEVSVGFSTRSDRAAEALQAAQDVIADMVEKGPTPEELAAAKKYLIGAYAIRHLSSTTGIAMTMVHLQVEGRSKNYIEERVAKFNSVTMEDVKRTAGLLFSVEPTVLMVGPEPKAEN
ncbi:pitrilysin family protein [Chelativorans sp.]|uniref:M16 family metallopeptidase n=1 Tax=Chelativorans sp. TaxID=2203393 RepID=UPI002811E457|nr:pitrilysin family protein [Chelativorans sp.]